jgi:NarL family two-component system sensor histidine kinase LiaS
MRRLGRRFGGLYWRLAVSYFLVTLVAVLTYEIVTVLPPIGRQYQTLAQSTPLDQMVAQEAPRVGPYLEQAPPDQQVLHDAVLLPLLQTLTSSVESFGSVAAVADRDGRALAAASCAWVHEDFKRVGCATDGAPPANVLLSYPQVQAAVQAALTNGRRSADALDSEKRDFFIVAPVPSRDGRPPGALVVVVQGAVDLGAPLTASQRPSPADVFAEFLNRLQAAGFVFLLLATAIGTLTGVLISFNLRRRLAGITRAADAWSRGELAARVRDASRDELGQLARELNGMAEQIRTLLATRQELAVVEERNRLARELHDSVKQHVFANALLVRAARKSLAHDPERARAHLAEAEELAGRTQQELIALIHALRPAAIADKGLVAVLPEYVDGWSRRMGVAVDLRVQGERPAPLECEEALFRVAQEALANVARHSDARKVEVRLVWDGEGVQLTIRDDGAGFDPVRVDGKGVGLASMRERVEALGGTLAIASAPGGTSIAACVPLASADQRAVMEAMHE